MSSPIAIVVPQVASESSASPSSSMTSSLASSAGLYVPVHKRAGSTSSRATTPSPSCSPKSAMSDLPAEPAHSFIYSPVMLLSLRPLADENVKERIRAACSEVLMNRKTRKTIEYMGSHQYQTRKVAGAKLASNTHTPVARDAAVQGPEQPAQQPVDKRPSAATAVQRLSAKNRPAGRAPERKRQALHATYGFGVGKENDSWRTVRLPPRVTV